MEIEGIIENLKKKNPPKKLDDVSRFIVSIPQGQLLSNISIVDKTNTMNVEDKKNILTLKSELKLPSVVINKSSNIIKTPKELSTIKDDKETISKNILHDNLTIGKPEKLIIRIVLTDKKTKIVESVEKVKSKVKTLTKKEIGSISSYDEELENIEINGETVKNRLPAKEDIAIQLPKNYLNNRKIFINKIYQHFKKYKIEELSNKTQLSCDAQDENTKFSLLPHQKIVKEYINLYTPYRGLLLYHGLGSGKTCSSIAIAEGLKDDRQILIMTPKSLERNYKEEIKKCGDPIYRQNQYWEFVNHNNDKNILDLFKNNFKIPAAFLKKYGGAFLLNVNKVSNFESLTTTQKNILDLQLNYMINYKYKFYAYNGFRESIFSKLAKLNPEEDKDANPFNNKVLIIDEAHNFVSRIINKLGSKKSISHRLYELIMNAENVKIIFLSGTPIINYPNEIAIMMNMLRGYIKTYKFKVNYSKNKQFNKDDMTKLLYKHISNVDYIDYSPSKSSLIVTKNPFGFTNTLDVNNNYKGVKYNKRMNNSISNFKNSITNILENNNFTVDKYIEEEKLKCIPDTLKEFSDYFVKEGNIINENLFKRRVIGLTSFFKSAQESLMPKYDRSNTDYYEEVYVEMSDTQFAIYEKERQAERALERLRARKGNSLFDDTASTYKIYSRIACNFVFPTDYPRPKPIKTETVTDEIENAMKDKKSKAKSFINKIDQIFNEDLLDQDIDIEDVTNEEIDKELSIEEGIGENIDENIDEIKENEDTIDSPVKELKEIDQDVLEMKEELVQIKYDEQLRNALTYLKDNANILLNKNNELQEYSPKFLQILNRLQDEQNIGIHLIYSQFRTLEGIGILKLVLIENGFYEFRIKYDSETRTYFIENLDELRKVESPKIFALYTGTETEDQREITRNILNGNWKNVPENIIDELLTLNLKNQNYDATEKENKLSNLYGDIIKIFMITVSGAEGISLKNVRFVHITEPYWNYVRINQVIGRARRICSHSELPEELQTVKVFMYLMKFKNSHIDMDKNKELILNDKSKIVKRDVNVKPDNDSIVTTDVTLYEISLLKENINNKILKYIKEASMDCMLHEHSDDLTCFHYNVTNTDSLTYLPNIENEQNDKNKQLNQMSVKRRLIEYNVTTKTGKTRTVYFDENTKDVYDTNNIKNNVKIGKLVAKRNNPNIYYFKAI
jgi:hypothetical protein